jgi:hypothetical protein
MAPSPSPGHASTTPPWHPAPARAATTAASQPASRRPHRTTAVRHLPHARTAGRRPRASTTVASPGTCANCHNGSRATGKPAPTCRWVPDSLRRLPQHRSVGSPTRMEPHPGGRGRPVRVLPHRWLSRRPTASPATTFPTPRWPAHDRPTATAATRQVSTWGTGRFHSQLHASTSARPATPATFLAAVGKPATAIHANVTATARAATSHQHLGGAKVDHSTFNAGHQLRQLPQRQRGHRQAGTHMPGGLDQLLQLPQRHHGRRRSGTTRR